MSLKPRPTILVTNDDGIESEGLKTLASALSALGHVIAVAPAQERSAISHAVSLYRPIRYEAVGPHRYAVQGTPADSVILAINHILPERPNLVVSGINKGANLGQNVFYSGTVAAAVEGTFHGIPSIAISISSRQEFPFQAAAAFAAQLADFVLKKGLPADVTLNVNFPPSQRKGARLTRRSSGATRQSIVENTDPRNRNYYWIHEQLDETKIQPDSDYAAIRACYISITPLTFECMDGVSLTSLQRWIRSYQSPPAR